MKGPRRKASAETPRRRNGKSPPMHSGIGGLEKEIRRRAGAYLTGVASSTSTSKGASLIVTGLPASIVSAGSLSPLGELSL